MLRKLVEQQDLSRLNIAKSRTNNMPEINIKLDDNNDLLLSLESRIKLLERLLAEQSKALDVSEVLTKVIQPTTKKLKTIESTTNIILDSLSSGLRGGMSVVPSPS
jgi:hypothetical protein